MVVRLFSERRYLVVLNPVPDRHYDREAEGHRPRECQNRDCQRMTFPSHLCKVTSNETQDQRPRPRARVAASWTY